MRNLSTILAGFGLGIVVAWWVYQLVLGMLSARAQRKVVADHEARYLARRGANWVWEDAF